MPIQPSCYTILLNNCRFPDFQSSSSVCLVRVIFFMSSLLIRCKRPFCNRKFFCRLSYSFLFSHIFHPLYTQNSFGNIYRCQFNFSPGSRCITIVYEIIYYANDHLCPHLTYKAKNRPLEHLVTTSKMKLKWYVERNIFPLLAYITSR